MTTAAVHTVFPPIVPGQVHRWGGAGVLAALRPSHHRAAPLAPLSPAERQAVRALPARRQAERSAGGLLAKGPEGSGGQGRPNRRLRDRRAGHRSPGPAAPARPSSADGAAQWHSRRETLCSPSSSRHRPGHEPAHRHDGTALLLNSLPDHACQWSPRPCRLPWEAAKELARARCPARIHLREGLGPVARMVGWSASAPDSTTGAFGGGVRPVVVEAPAAPRRTAHRAPRWCRRRGAEAG